MASRLTIVFKLLCAFAITILLSSCTVRHISDTPDSSIVRAPVSGSIYETVSLRGTSIEPANVAGVYHSVAPGETIWRISKMYDVDIETLKRVNNIKDVTDINIGTRLYIPQASARKDLVTLYPNNKWRYIVIHHSATEQGNSEAFNEAHLKKGWQGVGYHFVIDNGTEGKQNGQVETTPRWLNQIKGAHCKAGSMNEEGIGICLVGNFSKDYVSRKQMDSLVYLVNELKSYYRIPKSRIIGHGQVPGASTECPGQKFPWRQFQSRLRS